jgi:cytochrome c
MKHAVAFTSLLVLGLFVAGSARAADLLPADVERGQDEFNHVCRVCHARESSKIGPTLGGVVGRKVATEPGFAYSDALKSLNFAWDETTLDQWLTDPGKIVPGQHMKFPIVDPQKRADVIAYLKTLPSPVEK